MRRNIATIALFTWATFATLLAWGFHGDANKHLESWQAVRHERDALLVEHEGYRWLGNELIAVEEP